MHLRSHLSKLTRKELIFLLLGSSLMIGPLSLSAQSGKTSYQAKCASCHTIGGGLLVGPDLKGVISRRDRSWLIRWIQEPDKMLAEGDPIATQQLKMAAAMPNLGISETEAKEILAYIESGPAVPEPTTQPVVEKTAPVVVASTGNSTQGKQAFEQKCAICHSIGGKGVVGTGRGEVGPDLKGVTSRRETSWLVRWIQEPDKVLDEGDPIVTKHLQEYNNVRMPNLGISETEAKDILAYLAAESGDKLKVVKPSKPVVPKPTAPAGDPEIGRALFIGQQAFSEGGPACISCHTTSDVSGLGGGSLGPDLTKAYDKFGGNIAPILINKSFPTMKGVFSKKPVEKEEAAHLTAYFAETMSLEEKPSMDFTISMISIGGFIILYLLTHFIWRKRLTGVRIPLVGR